MILLSKDIVISTAACYVDVITKNY